MPFLIRTMTIERFIDRLIMDRFKYRCWYCRFSFLLTTLYRYIKVRKRQFLVSEYTQAHVQSVIKTVSTKYKQELTHMIRFSKRTVCLQKNHSVLCVFYGLCKGYYILYVLSQIKGNIIACTVRYRDNATFTYTFLTNSVLLSKENIALKNWMVL